MRSIRRSDTSFREKRPWNNGRLVGQKAPLKRKDIWAIRVWLQLDGRKRDLALFNLATDSKLRGCDLVAIRITDIWSGEGVASRAIVVQKKTGRPVQFEITEPTRDAIRHGIDAEIEEPSDAEAMSALELVLIRKDIAAVWSKLSQDHRDVLFYAGVERYSYDEVAEILGLQKGTVMSRLNRARIAARKLSRQP